VGVDGRVVLVTGAEEPLGAGVADELRARGAVVATVDVLGAAGARAALDRLVAEVVDEHGRLDVLVHAALPAAALVPQALADVDDDAWRSVWEDVMTTTLGLFAAAHPHLAGRDGRIVVAVPAVGLSGAAGLCPLATTVEGVRLLAKSAARQWGGDGITVNTLVVAGEHLGLDPAAGGAMSLAPPALGGVGDPAADIGPVVEFLAGEGAHFLTGATLVLDGGVWTAL
jgi:3-oxoacyl-[acyl-carrier protein] reductase